MLTVLTDPMIREKVCFLIKKTCCWIRMPGWWQVRGFGENTDRRLIMPEFCVMYLTGVTRNSPTRNCVI